MAARTFSPASAGTVGPVERCIGVVVFTDLVRSTEVFGRLGPADADRVRAAHFDDLQKLIRDGGGELVKTMGDGVMAVFALATNALQFAATAQAQFCVDEAFKALPGLRVGVSVGELTEESGDYHGLAAIEAARLCQVAAPGQVLCAPVVRQVIGSATEFALRSLEPVPLRGLSDVYAADELVWTRPSAAPLRVVLADDAVMLRQGIARLLEDDGFRVVGQAGDAVELLALANELQPDVVITDIRMPPTMNLDGLEAALEIRRRSPATGILVLSQHIETAYALQLLGEKATGVGYLLKERITAVDEFSNAVRRVADGGTAVDPEIVSALMSQARAVDPLEVLSDREREVLALMAEGLSNPGIAQRLYVGQRTVESHVASIFTKLSIPPEREDDRRVIAVVRYLESRH